MRRPKCCAMRWPISGCSALDIFCEGLKPLMPERQTSLKGWLCGGLSACKAAIEIVYAPIDKLFLYLYHAKGARRIMAWTR